MANSAGFRCRHRVYTGFNPVVNQITLPASAPDHNDLRTSRATLFLPDLCASDAVLVMIISVELFVVVIMLGAFGLRGFSWEFLAVTSFLALWVVLSSAAVLCALRRPLQRLPVALGTAACMLVILGITFVFSLPADWVAQGMPEEGVVASLDWLNVTRNLLIALIVGGMLLRYVQVQSALRHREHAELDQRYRALQARIRPHFLFNSMNMLASLVSASPALAETAIEDLCELFRAALQDRLDTATFGAERSLCESYLRIEQLRMGDRLRVDWEGVSLDEATPIPLLTLQPLLENAVYHGIEPLTGGGNITIRAGRDGDVVRLEVRNPCAHAAVTRPGNQMALENIRQRLLAAFGSSASVLASEEEGEFVVRIAYEPGRAPAQRTA